MGQAVLGEIQTASREDVCISRNFIFREINWGINVEQEESANSRKLCKTASSHSRLTRGAEDEIF